MWNFFLGFWLASLLNRPAEKSPQDQNDDGCLGCLAVIIAILFVTILFRTCGI